VPVQSKYLKLHQIYLNGEHNNTYTYDDEHRITSNSYQIGVASYEYENDTTFETLTLHSGSIFNYSKKYSLDANTVKHEYFDNDKILEYYTISHYNINPCGHSEQLYFDKDGNQTSRNVVEYLDSNCSQIETRYNSSNEVFRKITITKSDLYNAANSIRREPLMFDFQHEWMTRMGEDGDGIINPEFSFESVIIPNDDNYPKTKTVTNQNGSVQEYEYFYY